MKDVRGKVVRIVAHNGKACDCVGCEGRVVGARRERLYVRPFDTNLGLGLYKTSDLKYLNNREVVLDE